MIKQNFTTNNADLELAPNPPDFKRSWPVLLLIPAEDYSLILAAAARKNFTVQEYVLNISLIDAKS